MKNIPYIPIRSKIDARTPTCTYRQQHAHGHARMHAPITAGPWARPYARTSARLPISEPQNFRSAHFRYHPLTQEPPDDQENP